jgi:hypothetical protein
MAPGGTLKIVVLAALERPEKSEQADEPEAKRQWHENDHYFHRNPPTQRAALSDG